MRQVNGMSEDGQTIELKRFSGYLDLDVTDVPSEDEITGIFLDTETTGLNPDKDKIIDLGYIVFMFDKKTGAITRVIKEFSELEDPGQPLAEAIKKLTGYSDEDLKDKAINWDEVEEDFECAQLIIAHNAYFDRGFLDKKLKISGSKVWACSMTQIAWKDKGHGSQSAEFLCKDHGYFFDGHTALADVRACLKLLSMKDPDTNKPYLAELLEQARIRRKWVYATGSGYDLKDELKERGFRWEPSRKVWKKNMPESDCSEEQFLKNHPIGGNPRVEAISYTDNFKRSQ